jgi:hypothetical protein
MKLFKNSTLLLITAAVILAVVYYLYLQDQPLRENFGSSGGSIATIIVIVVFVIGILGLGIAIYRNPNGMYGDIYTNKRKPTSLTPAIDSLRARLQHDGGPPAGGKRGAKRRASH